MSNKRNEFQNLKIIPWPQLTCNETYVDDKYRGKNPEFKVLWCFAKWQKLF